MTTITVPRETWGALREALENSLQSMVQVVKFRETGRGRPPEQTCTDAIAEASAALTAANAASHPDPETTPAPKGRAITFESDDADMLIIAYMDEFDAGKKSVQPQAQGEAAATVVNALLAAAPLLYKAGHPQESAECNKALLFFTGAAIPAHPQASEPAANWATYPEKCPITRRDFFMVIEHPELGMVPTYGGPYDSYTIPHMGGKPDQQMHDRELMCHRFDHDLGYWVDDEIIPLRVIHDDFLPEDDSSKASEPAPTELERFKAVMLKHKTSEPEGCDKCLDPDGIPCFPQYGVGPHLCFYKIPGAKIGESQPLPKDQWPDNYLEDPDHPGMGVYWCPHCGSGKPAAPEAKQ